MQPHRGLARKTLAGFGSPPGMQFSSVLMAAVGIACPQGHIFQAVVPYGASGLFSVISANRQQYTT